MGAEDTVPGVSRTGWRLDASQKARALHVLLSLAIVFYPIVANSVFRLLSCVQAPITESTRTRYQYVLKSDPSVECYIGPHLWWTLLSWATLVIFLIGLPLGSFLFIVRTRRLMGTAGES